MGDAGSLFLGFILVMSSLSMIHSAQGTANSKTVLAIVLGVLALPVIDSLRVYRRRIKRGSSPLLADRSHFHHLVLQLGLQHRASSMLIVAITSCLILFSLVFGSLFGITVSLLVIVLFFSLATKLLVLNSEVGFWREKIKQLEIR
ncbi:hypothetical protein HER32_00405 [Hymenobacter sp. BT18]|uniref:hypothetical protein n=1 Tax=Hymenobacter sp. BT18 TaxID=2835648 RepID=UPI00143E3218|nr:hypothetical protein [Hymenobacter sp. BT18]QIX59734.1 hypothetical protein HER32_00405 [Hymenobacter sp. BT18]